MENRKLLVALLAFNVLVAMVGLVIVYLRLKGQAQ